MKFDDIKPLTEARVQTMSGGERWAHETAIMERINLIAARHAESSEWSLKLDNPDTNDWSRFGTYLKDATLPDCNLLDNPKYRAFLREMFAEIYDLLDHAYANDPSQQIYYLLDSFGWDGQPFAELLPVRANPMLWKARDIAEAMAAEQRLRDDQMGY